MDGKRYVVGRFIELSDAEQSIRDFRKSHLGEFIDHGTQSGYALVADSVISARTVRPGGKKGQQGQATDALNRAKEQQTGNEYDQTPPFDDDVPPF